MTQISISASAQAAPGRDWDRWEPLDLPRSSAPRRPGAGRAPRTGRRLDTRAALPNGMTAPVRGRFRQLCVGSDPRGVSVEKWGASGGTGYRRRPIAPGEQSDSEQGSTSSAGSRCGSWRIRGIVTEAAVSVMSLGVHVYMHLLSSNTLGKVPQQGAFLLHP